jgi:hypothetical protein
MDSFKLSTTFRLNISAQTIERDRQDAHAASILRQ